MSSKHVISVLVENQPGVLARVAGLFSRRGYNIDSLSVGRTEREDVSRMTIVVTGDNHTVEQVSKQLSKLIDVIKVQDHSSEPYVEREMVFIKVSTPTPEARAEVMQIVEVFRAKIVDVARKSLIIEVTGEEGKMTAFLELMRPFGILEMVRTGRIAVTRGSQGITIPD